MIKVEVNTNSLKQKLKISNDELDRIAAALAVRARDLWKDHASRHLHTSRDMFIAAIGEPKRVAQAHWRVSLEDPLAVLVEGGNEEFSLIPGRVDKVIPFHTRGVGSTNYGLQRVGAAYSTALGSKAAALQYGKEAQKLIAAGSTKHPHLRKLAKPAHMRGLHEGAKKSPTAGKGGFVTFRTVSADATDRWRFPARKGKQLYKLVQRDLKKDLPAIVAAVRRSHREGK